MSKVKQGKIITVDNKDRKFGANKEYYAIWVEDCNKKERCLLFTKHQLAAARHRAAKNPEDLPKKGFWANLFD